jgi:hypothetical protein
VRNPSLSHGRLDAFWGVVVPFTIELLATSGRSTPELVQRIECPLPRLVDAERLADLLVTEAAATHPQNPPDSYRILDQNGSEVARSRRRP